MIQNSWGTWWVGLEDGACRGGVGVIVSEWIGWFLLGVFQGGGECEVY